MSELEVREVVIVIKNYKNEVSERIITPDVITFGVTPYHTSPQWMLRAFDHSKNEYRTFPIANIYKWSPIPF